MDWRLVAPAIIVGGALVIIGLERWRPYDRGQRLLRADVWTDLVLYGLVQSYVLALVIAPLVGAIDAATGASRHGVMSALPFAAQVVIFIVLHDFYIYCFHRAQHHHPWLWRLHEAHHSAKEVDWIAGARSHALEIVINQSIELGAMVLLGASPDVILCKMAISTTWGMWIHANVDVRSGWLQYVVNGPEMHRWHHSIRYPGKGCNYATKLAFWDYLFATVHRPEGKPPGYGLVEWFPRGYLRQLVYAFRGRRR